MTTSDTITKHDVAGVLAAYLAMWNEDDAPTRPTFIEKAFTPDGRYADPASDVMGYAAINEMVSGVRAHYAGHTFVAASGIDVHHDQLRVAWQLVAPGGGVAVAGIDIGELAGDGRLRRMIGFFGELS